MKSTLRQLFSRTSLGVALLLVLEAFAAQAVQEFQVEGVLHITNCLSAPTSRRVQINYHDGQWEIREITGVKIRDPASFPAELTVPIFFLDDERKRTNALLE